MKHSILPFARSLECTQFALERMNKVIEKLVKAHNAQGKELKETQIRLNLQGMEIKRLRERAQRSDSE